MLKWREEARKLGRKNKKGKETIGRDAKMKWGRKEEIKRCVQEDKKSEDERERERKRRKR